jgi:putative copper export protein
VDADPLAPLLFGIKLGLYGSALLATGLGLHASFGIVSRSDQARTLRTALFAGFAALLFAALRLAFANVQIGGASALLDPSALSWTWPVLGPSTTATAIGAATLAAAWLQRSRITAGAGAIAMAVSFGLTGHSQALEPPGLAPWAVGIHVLLAAFWFAGPISLWPARNLEEATLNARVARFSKSAVVAVPLLFALGLWLAALLAGGWLALVTSLYGQLLLAKLGAASCALALGAYNRTIVTARLRTAPEAGQRALRLTLSLDAALFFIALSAVAAATSLTGPPSS